MLVFFINLIFRLSAFPDSVYRLAIGNPGCLSRSNVGYEGPDTACDSCGNDSAQFQGDERDVVFISMVDTLAGGPLPIRHDVSSTPKNHPPSTIHPSPTQHQFSVRSSSLLAQQT